ncbi:MAG: rhomboid family intramembrane serine protease [Bdellovibrionales bacterium]|nr:rhomboid family intramembrane serine protease [Bdellovibrionales bacterium]
MQQGVYISPLTPVVKKLIILNGVIWVLTTILFSRWFPVYEIFGLVPAVTILKFHIWQIVTYMFLHSGNDIFHILFNMFALYMFGSELERRWGSKFFLIYYFVCGVGAAVIYIIGALGYWLYSGEFLALARPVVGASGAVFGLFLAYGIIFGDRIVYFMMMFPMKAKWMVAIFGGIELVTLLGSGFAGSVANLAHLGGLISGFLFLIFYNRWNRRKLKKGNGRKKGNLRLVVDNDKNSSPRYWN